MSTPVPGDQYKDVVREAVEFSQECRQDYVGTEHLLAGMMRVANSSAAHILNELLEGNGEAKVVSALLELFDGEEGEAHPRHFNLLATRATELALRAAHAQRSDYIHTEHLLLGIVRTQRAGERLCVAVQALELCGLDHATLEIRILECIERMAKASQDT
jgi:ATP-dependent Clp protease ATP-binding subunit ClpA